MTYFEAYKQACLAFSQNGVPDHEFDAKCLLLHAFDMTAEEYAVNKNEPCDIARLDRFKMLCQRRAKREPLQYILGSWDFFGREFYVDEGCLIPRAETELTVSAALSLGVKNCFFADLCTGSGCIGISYSLEVPESKGILLDISDSALHVAEKNRDRYGITDNRLSLCRFDLMTDDLPADIDLLMSNPPYIDKNAMEALEKELYYEPSLALFGGDDGLDFYRAICRRQVENMKKGSYTVLELGIGQCRSVSELLKEANAAVIDIIKDSAGIERTIVAEKR